MARRFTLNRSRYGKYRKINRSRCACEHSLQSMDSVRAVPAVHGRRQGGASTDDKRLHWRAEIAGRDKEWDAEIFEQIPDQRVAWRSLRGAKNSGMVNFTPLGPNKTSVNLKLNYDPEGPLENMGDALGITSARVAGDLKRFKEFIEKRGAPTGAWRGEIHGRQVQSPGRSGKSK